MPALQEHPAVFTFLPERQDGLFFNPTYRLEEDYRDIYIRSNYQDVGWPEGAMRVMEHLARPKSGAVVGVELGDEGKGRVVDDQAKKLIEIEGVKLIYSIRVQGGNNAGHTSEDKVKLAQHLVPSGIMHEQVIGVMDSGMVIHQDLQAEVELIEEKIGDLKNRLVVSQDAILGTDLERAEELLNRRKKKKSGGGTGRGISPSFAHHTDRLGFHMYDLVANDWRENFGEQYDRYGKEFALYDLDLKDTDVIDFRETKKQGKETKRKLGYREEFLDRLETFRTWLIKRDMMKNTFILHQNIIQDLETGVLFELAQAVGLHTWLGTYPDVTSSATDITAVMHGTKLWRPQNILDKIGVFKITYDSSVGKRRMPTQVDLSKDVRSTGDLSAEATSEQQWAAWVRDIANEKGTTTGRPRDILHLDLEFLRYNCRMAGIEVLAGTHLDIARKDEDIKVCTYYTKDGKVVPYQPGLHHQEGVVPHYINLPGWDGDAVREAKSYAELPENAKKFLAFIQRRTGYPIVIATTGPKREHYLEVPNFPPRGTIYEAISL